MASHLSAIGFDVQSADDFFAIVQRAASAAVVLPAPARCSPAS
jgi:hypothetical protein